MTGVQTCALPIFALEPAALVGEREKLTADAHDLVSRQHAAEEEVAVPVQIGAKRGAVADEGGRVGEGPDHAKKLGTAGIPVNAKGAAADHFGRGSARPASGCFSSPRRSILTARTRARAAFLRRFDTMSLQRNIKALGTFGFQASRRSNQGYVADMPRTASGKIQKFRLREIARNFASA